jgi:hypothetical protein
MIRAFLFLLFMTPLTGWAQEVSDAPGAMLRGLDKVNGSLSDIPLDVGETAVFGRLSIRLEHCRFPKGNPAGNAFAYLTIQDVGTSSEVFSGWMIAAAPALNALDHSRYDVWVLNCRTD